MTLVEWLIDGVMDTLDSSPEVELPAETSEGETKLIEKLDAFFTALVAEYKKR